MSRRSTCRPASAPGSCRSARSSRGSPPSSSRTSTRGTSCATRSSRTSWRRTVCTTNGAALAPMVDEPPLPRVLVDDRQDAPLEMEALVTLAREVLIGEGVGDSELSLSFVTEDEIADLHERYMH